MISHRFAKALVALDKDVVSLREYFEPSTPDIVWLEELGRKGWPLITADKRIRSRPQERAILKSAHLTTFFLGRFFLKMHYWDQAVWLIRRWPRIEETARSFTRSVHFSVQQSGKMTPLPPT